MYSYVYSHKQVCVCTYIYLCTCIKPTEGPRTVLKGFHVGMWYVLGTSSGPCIMTVGAQVCTVGILERLGLPLWNKVTKTILDAAAKLDAENRTVG